MTRQLVYAETSIWNELCNQAIDPHRMASRLSSDEYKIAHALVRNGIYLNWRLAHRGSVTTTSFDDAYHVVNASYCAKFLTTDEEQVEQALHSLAGVQVGYCRPGESFDEWLTDNGYR